MDNRNAFRRKVRQGWIAGLTGLGITGFTCLGINAWMLPAKMQELKILNAAFGAASLVLALNGLTASKNGDNIIYSEVDDRLNLWNIAIFSSIVLQGITISSVPNSNIWPYKQINQIGILTTFGASVANKLSRSGRNKALVMAREEYDRALEQEMFGKEETQQQQIPALPSVQPKALEPAEPRQQALPQSHHSVPATPPPIAQPETKVVAPTPTPTPFSKPQPPVEVDAWEDDGEDDDEEEEIQEPVPFDFKADRTPIMTFENEEKKTLIQRSMTRFLN